MFLHVVMPVQFFTYRFGMVWITLTFCWTKVRSAKDMMVGRPVVLPQLLAIRNLVAWQAPKTHESSRTQSSKLRTSQSLKNYARKSVGWRRNVDMNPNKHLAFNLKLCNYKIIEIIDFIQLLKQSGAMDRPHYALTLFWQLLFTIEKKNQTRKKHHTNPHHKDQQGVSKNLYKIV